MALTRTHMTAEEATHLAALIDKSHAPYHVKRVMADAVEVQDDATGYTTLIHNADHWRMFISQSGSAGAVDMFGEAGTRLLAHLDTLLTAQKEERDRYLALAEQADAKAQGLQIQYNAIVEALEVVGTLDAPAAANHASIKAKRKTAVAPRKLPDGTSQADWLRAALADGQAKHVGMLAKELAPLIDMDERKLIQNLSSQLTDMIRRGQVARIERGIYRAVHPDTIQKGNN